ncbi:MAG: DUF262 domain-containing protein, partial [Treponema sp.]|nr:DUF262 domain-containing protein [Treponema sp.]
MSESSANSIIGDHAVANTEKAPKTRKYSVSESDSTDSTFLKELSAVDDDNKTFTVYANQFSPSLFKQPVDWPENFEQWSLSEDTASVYDIAVSSERAKKYIGFHFVVPTYQRGYRWEEELVKDLIDDIYLNYKKYYESIKSTNDESKKAQYAYCIQPLVLAPVHSHLNGYRVIDGQQRLTTLSLLLAALQSLVPPETKSKKAHLSISYESRPESGEYLFNITDTCKTTLAEIRKNRAQYPSLPEKITQSKKMIIEPENLDARYMLNTYLYAYWFFWERINLESTSSEYFSFAKKDWRKGDDPEPRCFELFEDMLLNLTSIIWYKIEDDASYVQQEQKIFENFNSGKIELTNAELIKGVFMNPDNYLEKFEEKSGDAFFQKLETRRIMLGNQWDEIEKGLHNPFIWDFIPHLTSEQEDKYPATRIDAIIDMYIYFNLPERTPFNFDDDKYSFKEIANRVDEFLKSINEDTEGNKNERRFKAMLSLWNEIRKVYTTFMEWYNGDTSLVNMNSIYHRISLLRRIMNKGHSQE